jgi:hypothetical protein
MLKGKWKSNLKVIIISFLLLVSNIVPTEAGPGESIIIHNNTGATLTLGGESTQFGDIPPNTKKSSRISFLRMNMGLLVMNFILMLPVFLATCPP